MKSCSIGSSRRRDGQNLLCGSVKVVSLSLAADFDEYLPSV